MANRGRMLRDTAMVTMDSLWELWDTVIDFTVRMVPLQLTFPKMGIPNVTDFFCVRATSVFAKLLWPLFGEQR